VVTAGALASFIAVLAVGCGGQATALKDDELSAWRLPAPYLPPPDPSAYAEASAAEPKTEAVAAPRDSAAQGAPTDAEIAQALKQAYGDEGGADLNQAAIDASGLAVIPETAPPKLVALMHAANDVARKPYVYGGGHGANPREIWRDSAYDCSGSISYALAAAGYLEGPIASGPMMTWGKPGRGKWVTIFANEGHAFMVVAGLRFDTSGRQRTGTRWQPAGARSYAGFTVRHPPGL
jgi:cell wall-associated NlpC family hydrolase